MRSWRALGWGLLGLAGVIGILVRAQQVVDARASTTRAVLESPGGACGSEAPPAQAVNAGFTTCAANFDFSQPTYAAQSNWLDCANTNARLPWHWGIVGVLPPYTCGPSTIFQTRDPTFGNTVLDLLWLNSYTGCTAANGYGCTIAIQTVMNGCGGPSCTGLLYPNNLYAEADFRIDTTGGSTAYDWLADVWMWQNSSPGAGNGVLEYDLGELTPAGNGAGNGAAHQQNGTSGGGFTWTSWRGPNMPSGYSVTTYHKYGVLVTSDGATSVYECGWVDALQENCVDMNAAAQQYANKNWLVMQSATCANNSGAAACAPNTNMYIEYYRIWSCANWNSTTSPANECNGTTLTNSGGRNSLIYWH